MDKKFITNFIKGSTFTSFGQFSLIVIQFISIMILTRHLSKDDFGIYMLILAIVMLGQILSGLGLDLTLVKFISSEDKNIFLPILIIRTISLLLVSILIIFVGHLILPKFNEQLNNYLIYIPLIFSLASFRELFLHLLQGLNQFGKYAFGQILGVLIRLILILSALKLQLLNLTNLIYIEIISSSTLFFVLLIFVPLKEICQFDFKIGRLRNVLKYCVPIYLNSIIAVINNRTNTFIIGAYLNTASISYFEVARKIPDAFSRMLKSFTVVYFPNLSKLLSQGKKNDAQQLMNKSLILFSTALLPLILVSFLFRNEILSLIFSERYTESSFAFSLLVVSFYLFSLTSIIGYSLTSSGYPSYPTKINFVSVPIGILSSFIMVPLIGFIGAVYSILINRIVSLILHTICLFKIKLYPQLIIFFKLFFLLLIISIFILLVKSENVYLKLIYVGAYIALCFIFVKEVRLIISFIHKYVLKIQ